LKAATKREIVKEESTRRSENRKINRKVEESLAHNNDADNSDHSDAQYYSDKR
jgi:hypothetical protein